MWVRVSCRLIINDASTGVKVLVRGPPSQYGSKHGTAKDVSKLMACCTCVEGNSKVLTGERSEHVN